MGMARLIRVTDLGRIDADAGVECLACGRLAVFAPWEVLMFLSEHHHSTAWPMTTRPFRCRCGSRDLRAVSVPRSKRPNPMPERSKPLLPLYVLEAKDRR